MPTDGGALVDADEDEADQFFEGAATIGDATTCASSSRNWPLLLPSRVRPMDLPTAQSIFQELANEGIRADMRSLGERSV